MSVVLILLTASLTVAAGFLAAFIWSVKTGQYEDDYTPSVRMLFENDLVNADVEKSGEQLPAALTSENSKAKKSRGPKRGSPNNKQ